MSSSVERRVKEIVAGQLGLDREEIASDSAIIDDLGADSLDIVELIMALEEEFEMDISDENAERIVTVEDAINSVRKNIQ